MVNYQNTKIYKIVSASGDRVYIDATAKEYLSQRFQQHKNDYKKWKEGKVRYHLVFEMFEKYDVNNCKIMLIESFPCMSKDEKTSRMMHHKNGAGPLEVGYVMSEEEALAEYGQEDIII